MRSNLVIIFILIVSATYAQSKKYNFSLHKDATNLIDADECDSILTRLDGFLANKNKPVNQNPFVYPAYVKRDINPFEFLFDAERDGDNPNFYKPVVLAVLPVIKHKQYVIKISYQGITPQMEVKQLFITTLLAENRYNNYYFFNAIDYNTRHWSKRQVGSIKYIFPYKLNLTKARQMDQFNKALARKFSIPVIPIIYYRCDDPEQLLKMMGYDYIANMYLSTSGGFAQSWHNTLLAGNNSELYVHELVHFYTGKIFPQTTRIMNEGYATYLGGSAGLTLEETKRFAKKHLDENRTINITNAFTNFDRVQNGIPLTYIISGLICRDIETKFGYAKIKELFKTQNEDQYFKLLQKITGTTRETFPAYVKKLIYN
jgi:hypothetical protein